MNTKVHVDDAELLKTYAELVNKAKAMVHSLNKLKDVSHLNKEIMEVYNATLPLMDKKSLWPKKK